MTRQQGKGNARCSARRKRGGRPDAASQSIQPRLEILEARWLPSAGVLDPTFGTSGMVRTDFSGGNDTAYAIAQQPDGKMLVAGTASNGSNLDFALSRYDANGILDSSFGTGGKVLTDFFHDDDYAQGVAIQGDGKIVVVGFVSHPAPTSNWAIARYNPDGTLDQTFGSGGLVVNAFGQGSSDARGVAIQPDGKLIVVGSALQDYTVRHGFWVTRYNPDGSLDAGFGTGGSVFTNFSSSDDGAHAVAVQTDGRIVVAGQAFNGDHDSDFAMARYNADGSPDQTFGSAGTVRTDFGHHQDNGGDVASGLALQTDGKIVVTGAAYNGQNTDFGLARYEPDGSLDASFGQGGMTTTDVAGGTDAAFGIVVQPNGKIVVGGAGATGNGNDFALARYEMDGSPDLTFGIGGKTTTDFASSSDGSFGLLLQPDGRFVAAGFATTGGTTDFALARYSSDSVHSCATLLQDDFNDNSIDPAKWTTRLPFGNSNVVEQNQRMEIGGRGYLITQPEFNPATAGPLQITGTWTFVNASFPSHDIMQILTRSDGIPQGTYGETTNGIEFQANGNDFIIINKYVNGVSSTLAGPVPITISDGDTISFTITDDGTMVTLYVQNLNTGATASLSATDSTTFASNHVVFHDREYNNGGGTLSYLDNVAIVCTGKNSPPTADAGGPYAIQEGAALVLDGSRSSDPEGDPLTYSWDVNGDGVFGDATGVTPTLTWAQLQALGIDDGPSSWNVRVRVADNLGGVTDSGTVVLTLANTAPTAIFSNNGPMTAGNPVTVAFNNPFDPSNADTTAGFRYSFDFNNDGDFTDAGDVANSASASASFPFIVAGAHAVHGRIQDKDGGFTDSFTTVIVNPGSAAHFTLFASSRVIAGQPFIVVFTAYDHYNNVATGYRGTVAFSTSDPSGLMPSPHQFSDGDAGTYTFSATLNTPRRQTINARDTAHRYLRATARVKVTASDAAWAAYVPTDAPQPNLSLTSVDDFFRHLHQPTEEGVYIGGR